MQTVCQSHPEKCIILQRMRSSPSDMIGYFSKVTIYYEDLNFEELVESPASTFAEFASNIGGAIGLWIGLSVLAMFEVVQLMIELCAYGFYLLCGKKRKVKDQFVRDHERENKIDIGEK
ncbi:degenerin unc-8-like [Saccostrea cucullata]